MSGVAARAGAVAGRPLTAVPWSPEAARIVAFGALGAFATAHWAGLVADPPTFRLALLTLLATAGGAALIALGRRDLSRPRLAAAGIGIVGVVFVGGLLLVGLRARLLLPGGWPDLADGLDRGLGGIQGVEWPARPDEAWIRLSVLMGAPLLLAASAAATFWPAGSRRGLGNAVGLLLLVLLYGTAVTEHDPGEALARGLGLLVLVAAWLWLPRMQAREALPAAALVLAVGLLALPVAAQLDADRPWWDYRGWNLFGGGSSISFNWDHGYGPLDWPRDGTTLLTVRSDKPHYWKAETLDDFDGLRWERARDAGARTASELPDRLEPEGRDWDYFEYNPRWDERIRFEVRSLRTNFVVGAGTTYSVRGAGPTAGSGDGTTILLDEPLDQGESYTVRSYAPDPSAEQMRNAPDGYSPELSRYTALSLPSPGVNALQPADRNRVLGGGGIPAFVPLRGNPDSGAADAQQRILDSPYARVYRLARQVTGDAPSAYEAVKRVETYLERNYDYSERPPSQEYPLAAFLFEDKIGYCQQFSGAMALMLRMAGIPARVAAGFSPGSFNRDSNEYRVRDLDAHSWVEVYFTGIGWVPFDPTPAAAPAELQLGTDAAAGDRRSAGSVTSGEGGRVLADRSGEAGGAATGSSDEAHPALIIVPLVALGGLVALWYFLWRPRRRQLAGAGELADAQLRELTGALERLGWELPGGTTLLGLERRLRRVAGPASAAYAAKLRAHRYDPGSPDGPGEGERRAVRRELGGRGLRQRLRAFRALPPWGPRPFSGA